jgi:hypothetical protein
MRVNLLLGLLGLTFVTGISPATARGEPAMPVLPHGRISGLRFRPGSHELGFTHSSAKDASDAYSLDLQFPGNSLTHWTWSETGGLDTSTFPEPESIRYRTFDGQQIPALIYRAPQGRVIVRARSMPTCAGQAGPCPRPVK